MQVGFKALLSSNMGVGLLVFLLPLMQGVYCESWVVKLPDRLEGITESCITVPCGFIVPEVEEKRIQNCSDGVFWLKGSTAGPRVFMGPNPFLNKIQGYIIGDLKQKNCTTVFQVFPKNYSDVYFFRLECPGDLKYTFSRGVIINTRSDPSPPQMSPVGQVLEGKQVTVRCSAPVFCSALPPSFTWLPTDIIRQETSQLQKEPDGQVVMTSTVTFSPSASHHNRSISCCVSYPLTRGGSTTLSATTQRLDVLYAPRGTAAALGVSGPVSEGRTVTLSCSSDANPPVSHYTWYRSNRGQLSKRAEGRVLILQVSLNDTGLYVCEALTTMGSDRSSPVSLEVTTPGSGYHTLVAPYILCGLLFVLLILIVAVGVKKYQSLSKRLKKFELQGEHTYANLRTSGISADYDHIQRQPKTKASSDLSDYENTQDIKISKNNNGQRSSKGLS